MTYEEAKPFLKEGVKVKIITNNCCPETTGKEFNLFADSDTTSGFQIRWGENDRCIFVANYGGGVIELEILANPDGTPWVHPDAVERSEQSFKVGDRVRVHGKDSVSSCKYNGEIGTVVRVNERSEYVILDIESPEHGIHFYEIEKIEDEPTSFTEQDHPKTIESGLTPRHLRTIPYPWEFLQENFINEPKAQKETNQMSVIEKLKNLALSKEDRILRENGLEDEHGQITSEAKEMMKEELVEEHWTARRLEIAKDLLKIKAEDCKK